ncbi:MAG: hypothetical protein ACK5DE_04795 [Bacteroidota bacterium]|jgi:hypothetical protein
MSSTYLQLVNNVLVRLRENEVSSVSDTPYSSLIGILVNDAKREVEDAHDWNCLSETIIVPTVAGTSQYTLTGSGQRFTTGDVLNDTSDYALDQAPRAWMNRQFYISPTMSKAPEYYVYDGVSGDDTVVKVWPIPDNVYSLRFELKVPQVDLAANADVLKVPAHLVVLLAHAKAISERGEDSGQPFAELYQQYRLALADAIALERNRYAEDVVWTDI